MKKLNVMIYTETLEALCELPNEDIGALIRHINDWNNGIEVKIENPYHKSMWKIILPELERNKQNYLETLETRTRVGRENGKKGGRPRKNIETQNNPMGFDNNPIGFSGNPKNPNYNYNYNYIDKLPKGNLSNNTQTPPFEGEFEGEGVSKGLEKLESIFPSNRNRIGIDEINMWNKLLQGEKQELIKRATIYVRDGMKKENGKYIKNIGKWLKEQIDGGITIKAKGITDDRIIHTTDGQVYTKILDFIGNTKDADKIYHILNSKELFKDKQGLLQFISSTNKQELLQLLN